MEAKIRCSVYILLLLWSASVVSGETARDVATALLKKYSSSGESFTLMETNSLLENIRHCYLTESAHKKVMSRDMKKQEHRNCSSDDIYCRSLTECVSGSDLEEFSESPIDLDALISMCPLLLYQAESKVCCDDNPSEHKLKPNPGEVWGYGILFVTLISLCSLVGVSVLPLMGKEFYHQLLTALVGLAVGSLSGSSVFHLIPQAFNLVNTDLHHSYLNQSILMWSGIWIFFMTERILKIIMDAKQRNEKNTSRKHLSSNCNGVAIVSGLNNMPTSSVGTKLHHKSCMPSDSEAIYECQEQVIKASFGHQEKPHPSHGHEHMVQYKEGEDSAIAVVAWMIIFGDGLHNFIDGLSIGAAFNESILTGISISVAVMCEEFPHELGDFAVLLNSGMKMRQAVMYNFLSACTCYVGLVIGILLGEIEASVYIFGFAAGMFLYISLVDMVPEMNEVVEEASKVSCSKAVKVLVLQNIGLFVGVSVLYVLARYQDQIQF